MHQMTMDQWLNCATKFDLGTCPFYNRPLIIQSRDQLDGSRLWVVQMEHSNGWVLGKDAEWHYEPLPSSRTDEFIANTRFSSPQSAYDFWKTNIKEAKELFIE